MIVDKWGVTSAAASSGCITFTPRAGVSSLQGSIPCGPFGSSLLLRRNRLPKRLTRSSSTDEKSPRSLSCVQGSLPRLNFSAEKFVWAPPRLCCSCAHSTWLRRSSPARTVRRHCPPRSQMKTPQEGRFHLAPRAGLEPATNRLHRVPTLLKGMDYIITGTWRLSASCSTVRGASQGPLSLATPSLCISQRCKRDSL